MKKILLLALFITTGLAAKELPSWGMTEDQYKMPNFVTKMKKIGDQAVSNDWLLKITAPRDWHGKIRSALSDGGAKNVQINFKDSLYKSIAITATPGMALKSTTTEVSQPGIVKKQVVIEKPEMDTEIEAPEFDNSSFKTDDLLKDIGQIELELPTNGHTEKKSTKAKDSQSATVSETTVAEEIREQSEASTQQTEQEALKSVRENLRMRYARGKTVDKNINYTNITESDDLYVDGEVVLVKRYVNRGVAIYYWMAEAYDPVKHQLIEKGSGKYVKSATYTDDSVKTATPATDTDVATKPMDAPNDDFFNFVAVTDNNDVQDQLRRDYIRNKGVNSSLKASQLKSKDILYVSGQTVLVERPLGNSRSAYYWLEGDTDIQHAIEHKGPQKFVLK
ncbi:hypothetical protein [Marinicella gelatinilytica]|uniref:hypothetical protein n=1 Tax=Marinicella gelatinilytica TaxID=2996017 RepID=UPI002260821E|nr:hypothetical protein [Marinicella gelatinilytica]MCX7544652.1 hypothetical protein [Marinicella gelatinilytica]